MRERNIVQIAGILKKCRSILFVTGAGISADSGLPTYRGIGGLYNGKLTEDGISIETALAAETLRARPELTWKYLLQIEKNCRKAKFNRAHAVIAEMETHFKRVWVLTQNIDGFHKAAGSRNIIDIHGDLHRFCCINCSWQGEVKDYDKMDVPPRCPQCQGNARPDVVFFGEMLPIDKLETLQHELKQGFDICFSVGTSSVFPYIRQPVLLTADSGSPTVEINPEETEISGCVDFCLRRKAAEALDEIWKECLK